MLAFAQFSSSGGVVAYYEIAATLIPILVFGGVVTDRLIPSESAPWRRHHTLATWGLLFAGVLAIFAEILAISAVVTESAGLIQRYVVSAALVGGILGAVWAFWFPWLQRASKAGNELSSIAASCLLIAAAMVAVNLLAASVDFATTKERDESALAQFHALGKQITSTKHRLIQARVRKADVTQQLIEAREGHEKRLSRLLVVKRSRIDGRLTKLKRRLDKLQAKGLFESVAKAIGEVVRQSQTQAAHGAH